MAHPSHPNQSRLRAGLVLGMTVLYCARLAAATTDISQNPLITASGTPVKPNVLFILDDSGSMSDDSLPEAATAYSQNQYGYQSSQCNGLAYNPATTYSLRLTSTGAPVANASTAFLSTKPDAGTVTSSARYLAAANQPVVSSGALSFLVNGNNLKTSNYSVGSVVTIYSSTDTSKFMVGSVTSWGGINAAKTQATMSVNVALSTATSSLTSAIVGVGVPSMYIYYAYKGAQPPLGYTYDAAGTPIKTTPYYKECASGLGGVDGFGAFTPTLVSSLAADKQQNYANWYTYYRTRIQMMKTVVSQAFKDIDDNFRVGYTKISYQSAKPAANAFLPVKDFDATHKKDFYDYLDGASTGGSTPLRGAVSNAGRYFAHKASGQTDDPIQYSCQRNFAILATDGGWNTGSESTSAPLYGPYDLFDKEVGQQDGSASLPKEMRDASDGATNLGSSNSLADVAMYFYSTDLRDKNNLNNCSGALPGVDVCENNVPVAGKDAANWQHLTLFTLSLGQNGTLTYDPNYENQITGDFAALKNGGKRWPTPVAATTATSAAHVDDLWHAAVNARGVYFNAADPAQVGLGITTALKKIEAVSASGAAAATSTLRPVAGNNQVFIAQFTSELWIGDLRAYRLDPGTGDPLIVDAANKDLAEWSAATMLKNRVGSRNIYINRSGSLQPLDFATMTAAEQADFSGKCNLLSQCAGLSAADKTAADNGANMVNFLRGGDFSVYRVREAKLGDIVGSGPLFVGGPAASFIDPGYDAYKKAQADRAPVVYAGANDGMMHAFNAKTGEELWAFVPTAVRSNLYRLADTAYHSNHRFFVDAPAVAADVFDGSWKTLLIFGLGAGGKSYVAMDVTKPTEPKLLWEFTDPNLGYTFARPTLAKRTNGSWVAVLPSGYNNADGVGRMFVINDISSGKNVTTIATTAGTPSSPSGLGPIRAWVDQPNDYTAARYYAGDLLGNVWRFDIDGLLEPKNGALLLAKLADADGNPQPITTAPEVGVIDQKGFLTAAVFVGTGRLLGLSDVTDKAQQSIYGFKESLAGTGLGNLRNTPIVKQDLITDGSLRKASAKPVDWSLSTGWFVDLPDAGERINVNMQLSGSTLLAGSNVPQSVASCNTGNGYSWLYYLNIANGSNIAGSVGIKMPDSMIVGFSRTSRGVLVQRSNQRLENKKVPSNMKFLQKANKTTWRELTPR